MSLVSPMLWDYANLGKVDTILGSRGHEAYALEKKAFNRGSKWRSGVIQLFKKKS